MQITITTKNTTSSLSWTYKTDNKSAEHLFLEKIIEESGFNFEEAVDGTFPLHLQGKDQTLSDLSCKIGSILSQRELKEYGSQICTVKFKGVDIRVNLHEHDDSNLMSLIIFHDVFKNSIDDTVDLEMTIQT